MSDLVLAKKSDMVALADALRELSGGTEELTFPGGMVEMIEAGGGGVCLPGTKVVSGTYVPAEEGTGVMHEIQLVKSFSADYPVYFFSIFRSDGVRAGGSAENRYLTYYAGSRGNLGLVNGTAGHVFYRHYSDYEITALGAPESSSSKGFGIPEIDATERDNCFIRHIGINGVLKFSTYGIMTLEAGKEYTWYAFVHETEEVE